VQILTEDIPEAYEIGDRIVVLRQGETVGEFEPSLTTLREIGLYMTGERFQGREEPFDEE
jgi:simple sugar transport system ATP-binding protein